jgi:hypothetical protein
MTIGPFRYLSDGRRTSTGPVPPEPKPINTETAHALDVDLSPLDSGVNEAWGALREVEDELLAYEQREQAHATREQARTDALARKYGVQR